MTLGELLAGVGPVGDAAAAVEISGLAYDSRAVRPGTLFFCVPGFRSDGHDFAAQALQDGAAALVVERPLGLGVPEVLVPSVRAAMGPVASRFYGDPTASLDVVGVTGTNGKTTTAFLVRALLQAAGEQTGLLGTITSIVGGEEEPSDRNPDTFASGEHPRFGRRTTPEAIDLHSGFRAMLDAGDGACAMEVSSHALELGRAGGIRFAAAVFTNLTQDHLDFHPSMEDYFLAKRLLFLPGEGPPPGVGVVNVGDSYGRRLAGEIEDARTFAVDAPADYCATDLHCDFDGCRFALHTSLGAREVTLPMPGRFNVANALGALATVHALGFDLDTLIVALERGIRVPGRFEPVDAGQDFAVLVDYAHTPDSLDNVLRSARDIARGRVISVFGAGGDRDRGKRPMMGAVSARLADITLVTSDNPRSEEPAEIVTEIVSGIPPTALSDGSIHVEVDRRAAIEQALSLAMPDDVVVIAGKGHEQGQEFADGRKEPFDDLTVARELLTAGDGAPAGAGE